MTDAEYDQRVSSLANLPFREDFETALYDLYRVASSVQRAKLREAHKADTLGGSKTWRNPTDYGRSDLNREQRMRQMLTAMSIRDGGRHFRDDLMSIAYCYHNLALLGVDADAVLEELAAMSSPTFARTVLGFVRRPPEGKSAESFGLVVEQSDHGPVAEFTL